MPGEALLLSLRASWAASDHLRRPENERLLLERMGRILSRASAVQRPAQQVATWPFCCSNSHSMADRRLRFSRQTQPLGRQSVAKLAQLVSCFALVSRLLSSLGAASERAIWPKFARRSLQSERLAVWRLVGGNCELPCEEKWPVFLPQTDSISVLCKCSASGRPKGSAIFSISPQCGPNSFPSLAGNSLRWHAAKVDRLAGGKWPLAEMTLFLPSCSSPSLEVGSTFSPYFPPNHYLWPISNGVVFASACLHLAARLGSRSPAPNATCFGCSRESRRVENTPDSETQESAQKVARKAQKGASETSHSPPLRLISSPLHHCCAPSAPTCCTNERHTLARTQFATKRAKGGKCNAHFSVFFSPLELRAAVQTRTLLSSLWSSPSSTRLCIRTLWVRMQMAKSKKSPKRLHFHTSAAHWPAGVHLQLGGAFFSGQHLQTRAGPKEGLEVAKRPAGRGAGPSKRATEAH